MTQVRYYHSAKHTQRVKDALNSFLAFHPLQGKDFLKLDALEPQRPMLVKTIREMLKPHLNPHRETFGTYEILYAARYVAYTQLANAIIAAGGEGRFATEFTLPGDPRTSVRFSRTSQQVAIADMRFMPDDELIRIDFPAFRVALPAKAKYDRAVSREIGLFVSVDNCSVLELNRLLRDMNAAELFQEAAKYAEETVSGRSERNPADGGRKFELPFGNKFIPYIVRLDGPETTYPFAFVLKRMEYPLDQLAKRFDDLVVATYRIVKDSMQG